MLGIPGAEAATLVVTDDIKMAIGTDVAPRTLQTPGILHRGAESSLRDSEDRLLPILLVVATVVCVLHPAFWTFLFFFPLLLVVLIFSRTERRIVLTVFAWITLASFSVLGGKPGFATMLEKISSGNLILGLYTTTWLLKLFLRRQPLLVGAPNRILGVLALLLPLVFAFYAIVGFSQRNNLDYSLKELNQWSVLICAMPIFLSEISRIPVARLPVLFYRIMLAALGANLLLGSYGAYGVITGQVVDLGWLDPVFYGRTLEPAAWRPMRVAYGASIFTIPLAIYAAHRLLISTKGSRVSYLMLGVSAMVAGLGAGRATICALALGVVLVFWFEGPGVITKNLRKLLPLLIFLVLVAVAVAAFLGRQTLSSGITFTASDLFATEHIEEDTYRTFEARGVWEATKDTSFLGAGVGGEFLFYNQNMGIMMDYWMPHNEPMYLLFKIGLIGSMVYFSLWAAVITTLWRLRKARLFLRDEMSRIMVGTIFSSSIALLLLSQFGPALASIHGFIITALWAAFVAVLPRRFGTPLEGPKPAVGRGGVVHRRGSVERINQVRPGSCRAATKRSYP
jgi:hypothetical protein